MTQTMNEVTAELYKHHKAKAEEEKGLRKSRDTFFQMATKVVEKKPLATMVVEIPEGMGAAEYVATHYPGWRLVSMDYDGHGNASRFEIQEDPALQPFIHIDKSTGMKYQRNAVQGQPLLDDERLREEDKELWLRVSQVPEPWNEILQVLLGWPENDLEEIEHITIPRELKRPEDMDPEDLQALADYTVPAPITLKLEPPRKATQEELEDD